MLELHFSGFYLIYKYTDRDHIRNIFLQMGQKCWCRRICEHGQPTLLCGYCPSIVPVLSQYCVSIVPVLSQYCPSIVSVLSQYFTSIVPVLSLYCASIVPVLSHPCTTPPLTTTVHCTHCSLHNRSVH